MKTDRNGRADICRTEYIELAEDTKQIVLNLNLNMNTILGELAKLSQWNGSPEVKRLLAIAITDLEKGAAMAVKAMTSEGFICQLPGGVQGERPTNDKGPAPQG